MSSIYMSVDEIKRRLREGTELEIIAELNGCSPREIRGVLKMEENDMNKPQLDKSGWMALYKDGLTAIEMTKKTGASITSIYNWHKDEQLDPNRKQGPKKHETIIKPIVPKPEQEPIAEKEVRPLMPWVDEVTPAVNGIAKSIESAAEATKEVAQKLKEEFLAGPVQEESEEKEMEKTSTRDIKGQLDPAILDKCFDEAVQNIISMNGKGLEPDVEQKPLYDAGNNKPLKPMSSDDWARYRLEHLSEWILWQAADMQAIDLDLITEYNAGVTSNGK